MIKNFLINSFCVILSLNVVLKVQAQSVNYDEVYKNTFRPDMPRSMQDIPYEDKDYKGKMYSPYAVVRISRPSHYEREKIEPGLYLVKPFRENNVDYLIFKKKDFALALVPVVEKSALPKKVKKMQVDLIEDNHGKCLFIKIQYKRDSYIVKLDIDE